MITVIDVDPGEPLSLEEVKKYLKIQHDKEDALIRRLMVSCREKIEAYTGRSLLKQTLKYETVADGNKIPLKRPPVLEISSVLVGGKPIEKYEYSLKPYIQTMALYFLPHVLWKGCTVEITYRVGYEKLPSPLLQGLLELISVSYEERGQSVTDFSLFHRVYHSLRPYRLLTVG